MSAPASFKVIGQSIKLPDGLEKVTGKARYAGDVTLPGMLHARPVLSPYAHATIVSIDTSAAEVTPGVVAVLTRDTIPFHRRPHSRNSAILARDRVVFRGQPVALVVAESEAAAADAADLVMVEYEPLPVTVDVVAAMQEGAARVWPHGLPKDEDSMASLHAGAVAETGKHDVHGNVVNTVHFHRGSPAQGFNEADLVLERTYKTGIVHQGYLEPHAAVADYDPTARELTIYTSTQGQYTVRDEVAKLVNLPKSKVRIVPMKVGGGFGAKYGIIEPLVAAAAIVVGGPVRLVLSRSEDFLATTPSPATVLEVKTGVKRDGTLTALQARVIVDTGAFAFGLQGIIATLLAGYYRFPNLDVRGYEVVTHKVPVGAYRAPGAPQATFAIESHMDEVARELGLDPIAFRLKNAVATGDPMPSGDPWPHIGLRQCLQQVAEHPLWVNRPQQQGMGRGVGLAVGGWPGGTSAASAVCRIDTDGTVNVHIGSIDISGSNAAMIQLAAEILGVAPESVRIVSGDTTTGPYAPNSGGSMITYTVGSAVVAAAEQAKKQLLEAAGEILEASPEDLTISDGLISIAGVPDRGVTVADVASKTYGGKIKHPPIVGEGGSKIAEQAPGFTAQLAEVEVDQATGEVRVVRNVIIQDVGRAINPMIVEGQVHGGATQGLGYGLWEEMVYDDNGQLLTSSLMDYNLAQAHEMPAFDVVLLENPTPYGPVGARGIGEPSIIAGAAAVANAIRAATGVRLYELPMRPEKLWTAARNGH